MKKKKKLSRRGFDQQLWLRPHPLSSLPPSFFAAAAVPSTSRVVFYFDLEFGPFSMLAAERIHRWEGKKEEKF